MTKAGEHRGAGLSFRIGVEKAAQGDHLFARCDLVGYGSANASP